MATHGYMMFTFRIHRVRDRATPLPLGEIQESGAPPKDALPIIYGIMRGLEGMRIDESNRHLTVSSVCGVGRCVTFAAQVGTSGQRSTIYDPSAASREPIFRRKPPHIENTHHRGLIVAPSRSATGLLILQAYRRRTGQSHLTPVLKRVFRRQTGLIIDFNSLVHEDALNDFLQRAEINEITLARAGLPTDIADIVEVEHGDVDLGRLKMTISRGRVKAFKRSIARKLQSDVQAREALLHVRGLDFNELSVKMNVGERATTLSVTAERVPSFVYQLSREPDDDLFYKEVGEMVEEVAPVLAMPLSAGWRTEQWSPAAADTIIEVQQREVARDDREEPQ